MKIRHDNNFLSIEPIDSLDYYAGYSIAAGCGQDEVSFYGSNEGVHFDQNPDAKKSFLDFQSLQVHETVVDLTENCFVRLTRLSLGDLQVDFQICRYLYNAKFVGRIIVDGELSTGFLRDLWRLAYYRAT